MKIQLIEDYRDLLTDKRIKEYSETNKETQRKFVNQIIQEYGNPSLQNIKDVIEDAFRVYGIDPSKNPFVDYFDRVDFQVDSSMKSNFYKLLDMWKMDLVDLDGQWYTEESLFDRNEKDFEYTVNAFEVANNPKELGKYLKDTTDITIDSLYDENGNIKPAGNATTAKDTDTIYGTIESWASNEEGNDNRIKYREYGSYSLRDVMRRFNIADKDALQTISGWIKKYWQIEGIQKWYNPKSKDPDYYVSKLTEILGDSSFKPLSAAEKDRIRKQRSYLTLDEIPDKEKKEGNIVFLRELEHLPGNRSYTDAEFYSNNVNDFVIYADGKWKLYSDYIENRPSKNQLSTDKQRLYTERDIEDISNKYSIITGILQILDDIRA